MDLSYRSSRIQIYVKSLPFNHLSYLSQTFVQYKTLLEDWSNYIDKLYENDHDTSFTPDMESNIFVDFTRLINVDMKTFIIAMAGNFHTRQRVHEIFVWWLSSLFFYCYFFTTASWIFRRQQISLMLYVCMSFDDLLNFEAQILCNICFLLTEKGNVLLVKQRS